MFRIVPYMRSALFRIRGDQLTERRVRAGLTQAALASKIGAHRSYISSLESGAYQASARRLVALAEALGCQIDDITERAAA